MLKHLYILLISTFFIGFLSGAFVYFVSRGPTEIRPPEEVPEGEFEIIVDMYGGCNMLGTCASYRIHESGEYTYIERSRGEVVERLEGKISSERISELSRLLRRTNFEQIEQTEFTGTCPVTYDGSAYRYEIRYGERYRIDSCERDIEGTDLFETLNGYFTVLNTRESE